MTALADQLAAGRAAIDAENQRLAFERMLPPTVYLYDGHQRLTHVLLDVTSVEWEDIENDVGSLVVTIDETHPAADWIRDTDGRIARGEGENVHVEYRYAGTRISGRVDENGLVPDAGGHLVTLTCLGEYENLKIPVWSNPVLPAWFQFPRVFLLAGPAIWCLKTTLMLQLLRINSSAWQIPNDPMNPMSWLVGGLDMSTWDVVVKPTTLLEDLDAGTVWCLVNSRFRNWTDLAAPILDDAELTVVTYRWRAGDPEPWPGAVIGDGALVVDIVDNSRHREGAANGGTVFDGLTRTMREAVGDLIEDTEILLTGAPQGIGAAWDDMFTTAPGYPSIHIPDDGDGRVTVRRRPAKGGIITMGGQSAPGVNEGISAGVQAGVDLLTSNLNINGYGVGPQGGAVDTLLSPFYSDVVAAFMSSNLPIRNARTGSSRLYEIMLDLPGKAYTLSSVMAFRAAIRETRGGPTIDCDFPSSGPWLLGQPRHGHAWTGQPVSFEVPGDRSGKVEVQRIKRVSGKWDDKTSPDDLSATCGARADRDPFETIAGRIRDLAEAAKDLGVWG
ncbi:hypothetical protein MYK68_13960 [Gordonia sp. PP30]|uniref:Gp37-like protein n=1 Tax=Gordonia sp. PP30 TaxID=2935861 RepID=UPI001FFECC3D|nr:hypothetical protein [Gordonia sp. PP30]UQE73835.1 hypothetical protein MYK68_13960 [Gordonia sp. PP30]